jgi:hypothetical protein
MNITINNTDLEVEYTAIPPSRGTRDSLGGVRGAGPPLEPDEEGYIEVDAVYLDGHDVTAEWEDSMDEIVDAILEKLDDEEY